uniref:Uncharacterized protein n=1 Tax=Photinus pyralis TaxID=7054 RepID=A0A1Y1M7X4_PHOPY
MDRAISYKPQIFWDRRVDAAAVSKEIQVNFKIISTAIASIPKSNAGRWRYFKNFNQFAQIKILMNFPLPHRQSRSTEILAKKLLHFRTTKPFLKINDKEGHI